MSSRALLQDKSAVVFGGGGSIGAAVAKQFAVEGAEVFLSGRTRSSVDAAAQDITDAEGRAHPAVLDALDAAAVGGYLDGIARQTGRIDVVFNAVGPLPSEYGNGTHAIDLTVEEFMVPLTTIVKSQFITARAAARLMVEQRSGVIMFLTGSPSRGHVNGATAIGTAFGAIETFMENLAFEVGPAGVRSVCLRTTANIDSGAIQRTMEVTAAKTGATREQLIAGIASLNFLRVPASISDTARAMAFLASDQARLFTGTVVNSSAGAALD
jgi:NAD(P)-dependent dehydrogenase (short-subunit alcohol dehydrogenase family)